MYQPRYLSGMSPGRMTKSNIIGYVAAHPIPEVIRGINAFTLGVRSVNPDAEVHVVWTNTWYDPVKEREAAVALLDEGADIITQHQDTTEPQKAAPGPRAAGSIGNDSDRRAFVRDTGPHRARVWTWGCLLRFKTGPGRHQGHPGRTAPRYWGRHGPDGSSSWARFQPQGPAGGPAMRSRPPRRRSSAASGMSSGAPSSIRTATPSWRGGCLERMATCSA